MRKEPGFADQDRLLSLASLSFDMSVLELWLPLTTGATIDLATDELRVSGQGIARRLRDNRISVLQATPVTWRLLLESGWRGGGGLKAMIGGEALSRELAGRLVACVDELWNMYGPTETTVWSALRHIGSSDIDVLIGRPIDNTTFYVLDGRLEVCPIGVLGELCIGGSGMSAGYQRKPALSAEKFVPNPFASEPGERIYRTGDLVRYRPDGNLQFMGRVDHQVKIRGFRIELGEIETVLSQHPHVNDAIVTVTEDTPGNERLAAYVVIGKSNVTEDELRGELRAHAQEQLPPYMIPAVLVMLDGFPLTPSGKVDRKALVVPDAGTQSGAFIAPIGETEERLATLWCDLLGVDQVGRGDNFFDSGGHSLLATQLISRIRDGFSLELRVQAFYKHPVFSDLASHIDWLGKIVNLEEADLESMSEAEANALLVTLDDV
jgi:acyl-coenzyme A synthetase/AMP-(fatty) acid ligase